MSDRTRIALVGATGLVGRMVMASVVGRADVALTAIARHEAPLPRNVRMEMFVAEPGKWGEVIEAVRPDAMICALGTTWRKAGQDEAAFRAIDRDLVLATAHAALAHGVTRMVLVSAAGAALSSKAFYLRVKAEVERDLAKLDFQRIDILRPGLLRGERGADRRLAERAAIIASPLTDLMLHGRFRPYRSISAKEVARASLYLSKKTTIGRYLHDNDMIRRAARALPPLRDV